MPNTTQSRMLVRAQPYGAQKTHVTGTIGAGLSFDATFDIAIVITDRNQLAGGNSASIPSVGPMLDVTVIADQVGTLDAQVAVDNGDSFRSILAAPIALVANTIANISGMRIPARYVKVVYVNTSAVDANLVFGAYVRSN